MTFYQNQGWKEFKYKREAEKVFLNSGTEIQTKRGQWDLVFVEMTNVDASTL